MAGRQEIHNSLLLFSCRTGKSPHVRPLFGVFMRRRRRRDRASRKHLNYMEF